MTLSFLDRFNVFCLLLACSLILAGCGEKQAGDGPVGDGAPVQNAKLDGAPETATPVKAVAAAKGWDDLPAIKPGAGDWPWWRGPGVNNIAAADQKPPTEWSEDKNILWRVKLKGKGHGTPCVWGDRIFMASGDKTAKTISVFCLDSDTGKEKWRKEVYRGEMVKMHRDNSYATAMIACDGERVFFSYQTADAIRMVALSVDGEKVWDEQVAKYWTVQGHSTSPAIYKSAVITVSDRKGAAALVALHRKTGKVIWRVARPGDEESYGSPLVAPVAGRDQLFIIGPDHTRSYDPATGKLLWVCNGPAKFATATVGFDKDSVYATGGYPEKALLAIRADGKGNVTRKKLRWKSDRKAGYVPSPLVSDGLVYAVIDKGLMRCYDAKSGKVVWERHLQTPFYSSPVLVGKRIYLFDRKGAGFIIQAGDKFKLLAENKLKDGVFATPVIVGGRIYLRTLGDLYCITDKK